MRVATLGSGSRGNCVLVECGGTRFLVDAGFSGSEIARRLEILDVDPGTIEAILVTHEHRDHTAGVGIAARRWGWTLYATPGTAIGCADLLRGEETVLHMEGERPFLLAGARIEPIATCHDAAEPVALAVTDRGSGLRVGIATDLGRATVPVRAALAGCHFLVLESNHDEVLLRESPYPWAVKQRIGGSRGHLSNRLAADLASELLHPELGGVLLAHLSDQCNHPDLAREAALESLTRRDYRGFLAIAEQDAPSPLYDVEQLVTRAAGATQLTFFA